MIFVWNLLVTYLKALGIIILVCVVLEAVMKDDNHG